MAYTEQELLSILEYSAKALGATDEEIYEFTRCVRPDGSAYGSRGKCNKGTEVEKGSAAKKTRVDREQAAREALQRLAARGSQVSVRKKGGKVVVSKGSEYKAVLHPQHQSALKNLKEGEKHELKDEQGMWWTATRSGDNIRLEAGDRRFGSKPYKLSLKESDLE